MTLRSLKDFISNRWHIILIVIISFLLPAIWLREKLVIAYAEPGFTFLINPLKLLDLTKYVWWDIFGLGVDNARALPSALYHLMTNNLQLLGFSAVARQYLIFSTIILLSALSMYFLALDLSCKRGGRNKFIALVVALFYILNPYTMNIWHRFTSSIFVLPLLPLLFLITIKLLKKPSFEYTFLFALITLLFSVNAINLGYFIPIFLPAIFYIFFEIFRTKRFKQWKYFGLAIFLAIGLNFWWLLPLYNSFQAEYVRTLSLLPDTLWAISQWTPILFISRLIDSASINWWGVNYHPGWIEFLIPLLATIAILFGIKQSRNILFFALLLIIGLFLGKGLQAPGGFVYRWMFDYLPFFGMFRSPFEKFGLLIAFSYSFLVPLGIMEIQRRLPRFINGAVLMVILVLLFGFSVWPMWTGDVFSFYQGAVPTIAKEVLTPRVEVPAYWKRAADHINRDRSDYRIVFLPQSPFDGIWYRWKHGYAGVDFGSVNLLFDNPVISQLNGNPYADAYRKMVLDNASLKELDPNSQLLSLMNIRYILVRNDVNETTTAVISSAKVKEILNLMPTISKIVSFGKLDLYKISDEYFIPHVYLSTTPTVVSSNIKALVPITKTRYLDEKPTLLFTEQMKETTAHQSPVNSHQMKIFVLKDSNWQDLAVELVDTRYQILDTSRNKIRIKKSGVYEVYVEAGMGEEISELGMKIDGRQQILLTDWVMRRLETGDGRLGRKYIKAGEVELEEGKHIVEVISNPKPVNRELKVVLVNKEERKRIEKGIWQKINQPQAELCYIFEKEKSEFYVP